MQKHVAGWVEMMWAGALLVSMGLPGCGVAEAQPTFPVRGKILLEPPRSLLELHSTQGGILFQSVDQPDVQAYGAINEDGTFELMTSVNGVAKEGAIAGKHRGRLMLDDEVRHFVAPKFLDVEQSGITITVPTEGEVVVKLRP